MLLDLKCVMPCQQIHYASGCDTSTHFSKVVEAQGFKNHYWEITVFDNGN